jgi:hypothetical protein
MPGTAHVPPGEDVVGVEPEYKPLPFQPEVLEVPVVPVDFPSEYRTPAQEAAWSEPDFVEKPIPILKKEWVPEPEAVPEAWDPDLRFRTVTAPTGVETLVEGERPYRRVVTVLALGDAVRVQFTLRLRHVGESMLVVGQESLPFPIPLFPFQELFLLHNAGVDEECSFQIEPRPEGR